MFRRPTPILTVGLRLVLAAALGLFAASSASAASPRVAREPTQFASPAQRSPVLLNRTEVTIQGERVPGGCRYTGTVVVRPGESAVEQHEIFEDPVSCTVVMEQGTPVGDTGADALSPGSSLLSGTKKAPGARPSRTFAATTASQATQYSAGYTKTWVTDPDPPDIDVNTVTNEIEWYWDGVYMTPSATNYCHYVYTWAWQTGWGLHENDFRCDFNQPDYPQSWLSSNSYVHFKNGIFCAFTDTHVYYDRNRAIGWGDGRLVGQWYVFKSGNCQGLLDVHSRTERTVN